MKKFLFITIVVIFTTTVAFAQRYSPHRGDFFLNAGVSNINVRFAESFAFNLNVSGGYFLFNKLALITQMGFGYQEDTNTFGIGAGLRFYIPKERTDLFVNGILGLTKMGDASAVTLLTLETGYSLFLNERIAFEPLASLIIPFSSGADVQFTIGAAFSIFF